MVSTLGWLAVAGFVGAALVLVAQLRRLAQTPATAPAAASVETGQVAADPVAAEPTTPADAPKED